MTDGRTPFLISDAESNEIEATNGIDRRTDRQTDPTPASRDARLGIARNKEFYYKLLYMTRSWIFKQSLHGSLGSLLSVALLQTTSAAAEKADLEFSQRHNEQM